MLEPHEKMTLARHLAQALDNVTTAQLTHDLTPSHAEQALRRVQVCAAILALIVRRERRERSNRALKRAQDATQASVRG